MKYEYPTGVKVSKMQLKCLIALHENCDHGYTAYSFWFIAEEAGITKREARIATRALVRKNLVDYVRGLFDDDGNVAGSGHAINPNGIEHLVHLKSYPFEK